MEATMEFGIFDHVEIKDGLSVADNYRGRLELAALADEAGCFCYHISEHHFTPLSTAPSPNLMALAIAMRTQRLRVGPLGALLPLYEPVRLVEEICMLDQLSGGRLELGIGRGVSRLEVKLYNVDPDQARAMFDEALEVIRRGLTQPVLDYSGEFYDYDTVPMEMKPLQFPMPPIWYPTSNLASVPWVAKQGFNTIFAGELGHIAEQVSVYRETIDPALAGQAKYGIHPFIVVAPTDAEAMAVGESAYRAHHDHLSYLRSWSGRGGQMTRTQNLKAPHTLAEAVAAGWAAAGSPDSVRGQLAEILGRTGCNYLLCTPLVGNTPVDFGLRALGLLADKVLPGLS
jgi:alkanesulfonate monooxygenase SsuD/methylene tetrahydromethanopterin reductase-like flavin-dependent oxidoreductase (luciferase family)